MIRSLGGTVARVSTRNGQFIIKPIKKAYHGYKENLPRYSYNAWASRNEDKCFVPAEISKAPLISVVVPAYNPEAADFSAMVYSVVNQHYANWELIIVNASDNSHSKEQINDAAGIDKRIKVVEADANLGISGNTNLGLEHCQGDFIAFFDHDDLMHPCALHCAAAAIETEGAELVYTDEDKIKADNSLFFEPLFKPKWSPDLFRNVNYINHLTVIKADYVHKAGGLRPETDGAQDYDFLLRIIDKFQPIIVHVPRMLYHWRAAKSSTAADFSTKSYVLEAGVKALQDHLSRNKLKGRAKAIAGRPGFYEIHYAKPASLSLVIGPVEASRRRTTALWVAELFKGINNDKTELVIGEWFKDFAGSLKPGATLRYIEGQSGYWQKAAELISSEIVVCFAAAALPREQGYIDSLAAYAAQNDCLVQPLVISKGGTIIDAGLVESEYGLQYLFREYEFGESTYYGSTEWNRNVAGLTMRIFAAKRELFEAATRNSRGRRLAPPDNTHRYVVAAQLPFIYKSTLTDAPMTNEHYFNPQLNHAFPRIAVRSDDWDQLGEAGERAS